MSDHNPIDELFGKMPNHASIEPFNNEDYCGLTVKWMATGTGFGELVIAGNKKTGKWHADTEEMNLEWIGKMLMWLAPVDTPQRKAFGDAIWQLHGAYADVVRSGFAAAHLDVAMQFAEKFGEGMELYSQLLHAYDDQEKLLRLYRERLAKLQPPPEGSAT